MLFHIIKKHSYTIALIVFTVGMFITKAPLYYAHDGSYKMWIMGWCGCAVLVGLHETKSVLMDYVGNKNNIPLYFNMIKISVGAVFIWAVMVG